MAESALGGRYQLVEQLGAGGTAIVWRAYDRVLHRDVAIKVLGPQLSADPAFVRRLRAEALAAARLSHPRITSVHDYGESVCGDGTVQPYVVMELLEGHTLASVLAGGRRMAWQRAAAVCAELASALADAHQRGIVHRDVSSSNIMLTPAGVKVMDFGISALIGEREPADSAELLGTPAYVAPERLCEGEITPAVDVYAVGVLLYRALAGRFPWHARGSGNLLAAHLRLPPRPLPPLPGLPPRLAELCYRCLAKQPADRPSSMELARDLELLCGLRPTSQSLVCAIAGSGPTDEEVPTQATSRRRQRRRRRAIVAIGLILLLVSTAGAQRQRETFRGDRDFAERDGGSGGPVAVGFLPAGGSDGDHRSGRFLESART